jgi:hypothetical protein
MSGIHAEHRQIPVGFDRMSLREAPIDLRPAFRYPLALADPDLQLCNERWRR